MSQTPSETDSVGHPEVPFAPAPQPPPRPKWHSAPWWAGIGGVAAVIATLIGLAAWWFPHGANGPGGSGTPTISITSVGVKPTPSGGLEFTFTGVTSNLPDNAWVFVVARSPGGASPGIVNGAGDESLPWLVSPMARTRADGRWSVVWDLSKEQATGTWTAVIFDSSCPHGTCAGNPYFILGQRGPSADGVVSTGQSDQTAPAPSS
ncbi:hypothetical protein [Rugosimonospora africana]|uniref:hypothetical protein n=1 Tax=Rugosimonospora africana TaxID=556532 RepID=UPI001945342B|nr:hypothetical protein [Rugosimonospora africana]